MDKDTIIEYIKKTPGNTNPAVLGSMVDSVSGGVELPPIETGDAGKVLTVNAGETAAVWSTPSGGAKFGPYQLCIPANKTINAGTEAYLTVATAIDMSGNPVTLPTDDRAHYFSIVSAGLPSEGLAITAYDTLYDFNRELAPSMYVKNVTNSSITLDAGTVFMTVLSDVELEPSSTVD